MVFILGIQYPDISGTFMNFQDFWGDFHMCSMYVSFRGLYIAFTFGERPMSLHFEFQVGDLSQTRTMGRII